MPFGPIGLVKICDLAISPEISSSVLESFAGYLNRSYLNEIRGLTYVRPHKRNPRLTMRPLVESLVIWGANR